MITRDLRTVALRLIPVVRLQVSATNSRHSLALVQSPLRVGIFSQKLSLDFALNGGQSLDADERTDFIYAAIKILMDFGAGEPQHMPPLAI